jgi:hypothetical protein
MFGLVQLKLGFLSHVLIGAALLQLGILSDVLIGAGRAGFSL